MSLVFTPSESPTPLNQIHTCGLSSSFRPVHYSSGQSKTKPQYSKAMTSDRLMRDRWWFNCARFIEKAGCSVFSGEQSVQTNQGAMPQVSLMRLQSMGLANKMTLSNRLLVGFDSSSLSTTKRITRSCCTNRSTPDRQPIVTRPNMGESGPSIL